MYKNPLSRRPVLMATLLAAAGLITGGAAVPVAAAETRIPVMSQGDSSMRAELPDKGQSQDRVRQRFGEPEGTKGPTGEPPISQWFYEDFVVYFEYDHVIHTVVTPR